MGDPTPKTTTSRLTAPGTTSWRDWLYLATFVIGAVGVAFGVLSRLYYPNDRAIEFTTAAKMSFKKLNTDYTETKRQMQILENKLRALEIAIVRLEGKLIPTLDSSRNTATTATPASRGSPPATARAPKPLSLPILEDKQQDGE